MIVRGGRAARRLIPTALVAGFILLMVPACHRRARPNVLLVTVDTLRADRLGCYGFGLAHTPAIDRLAEEGVRCTDAASSAPITLPAHASIMTGLYPPAHGVRDNGNYALGPDAVTLAERLGAAGYRTAAFVSAAVLTRSYGLDQGFGVYDDDLWSEDTPPLFMIRERPARRTTDRTLRWLDDWKKHADGDPFFLWVHFFDPHQPLNPVSADLAAIAPTPYDAEIAEADRGVGRLVEWLRQEGVLDETLVVFTADHGESLDEHGEPTHGIFVYDSTIHVPLIWRLPGVLAGNRTYGAPVRHIDIAPTVLSVLGLRTDDSMQGANLLGALQGRTPPPDLVQYAETRLAEEGFGMAPLFAVRHGGRKWIQAPRPELYDLTHDPRELTNLYPSDTTSEQILRSQLEAVTVASERRAVAASTRQIDRETEEMLRALGYLAPAEQRAETAGRDPKDGMALYNRLQEARQLIQVDRVDRAKALLDEVLAAAPENVTARNLLAFVALKRDDLDEAERQYVASLEQQPRQHRVHGALGTLALRRGDLDESERRFQKALELAPSNVEAMSNLGFIDVARGDDAGAEVWYERAIAIDPTYPHVHRRLADLFYDRKDYARALDYYRRALTVLPDYFEVLIQAGNSARFLGDVATASAYYDDARRLRGDSWIPTYNIACLRALNGAPDDALTLLGDAIAQGLNSQELLDDNPDLETVRMLQGWQSLRDRLQAAAKTALAPRGRSAEADALVPPTIAPRS
jgi:arylsulfatase A-like enzyme/Tfp pilus assembly protein PilF